MYDNESTDVTLVCADGTISAPKATLVAFPYFEAMFSTEMMESNSNTIQFKYVSSEAMKNVLTYLHTNNLQVPETIDFAILKQVLQLAHLMSLTPMFNHVWKIALNNLTQNNICDMWDLMTIYDESNFPKALSFIKNNMNKTLVSQLTPALLKAYIFATEGDDEQLKLLLDWGSADVKERSELVEELLTHFGTRKLSEDFVQEIVNGLHYKVFKSSISKTIMKKFDSAKNPLLQIYLYTSSCVSKFTVEKYCTWEKKWILPCVSNITCDEGNCRAVWHPVVLPENRYIFLGSSSREIVSLSPSLENVSWNAAKIHDLEKYKREWMTYQDDFLYVWAGDIFRYDFKSDLRCKLPPISNMAYAKTILTRPGLLFLDTGNRIYKFFTRVSRSRNKWRYYFDYSPGMTIILSRCTDKSHINCKLYFESGTSNDFFRLSIYSIRKEKWLENVVVEIRNIKAVFGCCDHDFILLQSKNDPTDLWILYYLLDPYVLEKLPSVPFANSNLFSVNEDFACDVFYYD